MNPATYIKDTLEELKQVSWPKASTVTGLTVTVILISAGVAAYVGGLDFLFTNLLTLIVK